MMRLGGEKGVASSAGILPLRSRQIESTGWWELPAYDPDESVLNISQFASQKRPPLPRGVKALRSNLAKAGQVE
jgi:hypothetical protein